MKYDLSKKPTIGAARTLDSLYRAMFALLSERSFEEIAVQELCERAMLPRATFYNYFDDKYDLLNYCFELLEKHTHPGGGEDELLDFLDRSIDFFDRNAASLELILSHNGPTQILLNSFRLYMVTKMAEALKSCPLAAHFSAPREMVARLLSECVWIVLEWKYLDRRECSKEQAKAYLQMLVGGILPGEKKGAIL